MSFNGFAHLKPTKWWANQPEINIIDMAKWEIHKRFGVIDALWWKLMPGSSVTVNWPVGYVDEPAAGGGHIQYESADPNDHYRPWLEKNAGRQGWDWNWRIGPAVANNGAGTRGHDSLVIKFRSGKEKYATIAALKWNL